MMEIECPFCDGVGRLDMAVVRAEESSFRCDACNVEVEVTDPTRTAVALAA